MTTTNHLRFPDLKSENPQQYLQIPIPIHPDDKDLPLSVVRLKMPSGKVFEITFPIQGARTIHNILDILEIWKPTIVLPESAQAAMPAATLESGDLQDSKVGVNDSGNPP